MDGFYNSSQKIQSKEYFLKAAYGTAKRFALPAGGAGR